MDHKKNLLKLSDRPILMNKNEFIIFILYFFTLYKNTKVKFNYREEIVKIN